MNNEIFTAEAKKDIGKILFYFMLAFIPLFLIYVVNQLLLSLPAFRTYKSFIMLMIYTVPTCIIISMSYAVCIGFSIGLIKINIYEKYIQNKKNIIPVIILGLIITFITFIIYDNVLPKTNEKFTELHAKLITGDENFTSNREYYAKTPREMSSTEIIKYLKNKDDYNRFRNFYLSELNRRYTFSINVLIFTLFALSLSMILKKHFGIALAISIISCIFCHTLYTFLTVFSVRLEGANYLVLWIPNVFFLVLALIFWKLKSKTSGIL